MPERTLLAACGLYCGACYHYRASFPDGAHLLSEDVRRGRPLAGYTCAGCWSDQHYVHPGCRDCSIRACAAVRGMDHCGDCVDVPCERLTDFQYDGRKHHLPIIDSLCAIRSVGADRWLADQAMRWTCAECGQPFSWYEPVCVRCGAQLDSYGLDEPA